MTPLARLQAWLQAEGPKVALVTDPVSIAYLAGFRTHPGERFMALALAGSRAVLVVPTLEFESAEAAVRGVEVAAWRDGEDPMPVVASILGSGARVAVEKAHLTLAQAEWLRAGLGAGEMTDLGGQVRRLRATKSLQELELLAHAAAITDQIVERILPQVTPGRSELEVAVELSGLVAGAGASLAFAPLVQFGPDSALPHLHPSSRRLAEGDLVLLDFGAGHRGYRGDITRMAVAGAPDDRQVEVHGVVLEAHDRALASVHAGVTAGEVDAAARRVIEAAGLGERFIHRTGHGLGLEAHEDPSLDPGSAVVLEAGMVITIEPGVYIPGWGGIRIEDDVVVEPAGGRLLTHSDRSLRILR